MVEIPIVNTMEWYKRLVRHGEYIGKAVNELKNLLNGDLPTISLLSKYEPEQEWFEDGENHGVMHATRVLILQELLTRTLAKKESTNLNSEALRWAASTHDVGRKKDYWNDDHGIKSAEWIEINFKDKVSPESFDILKYIVEWHYSPAGKKAPEMTPELTVLKDADSLDRERVKWESLDLKMLHHNISRTLLPPIARHLLFHSARIKTQYPFINDFQCVMQAGVGLGIIKAT